MITRKAEGVQLPQQQGYQGDRSEVRSEPKVFYPAQVENSNP